MKPVSALELGCSFADSFHILPILSQTLTIYYYLEKVISIHYHFPYLHLGVLVLSTRKHFLSSNPGLGVLWTTSKISSQFKCDQSTWGTCWTKTILSSEGGACVLSHNWLVTGGGGYSE
jgi:hypothetical protein